jgi:hypothetical protein
MYEHAPLAPFLLSTEHDIFEKRKLKLLRNQQNIWDTDIAVACRWRTPTLHYTTLSYTTNTYTHGLKYEQLHSAGGGPCRRGRRPRAGRRRRHSAINRQSLTRPRPTSLSAVSIKRVTLVVHSLASPAYGSRQAYVF